MTKPDFTISASPGSGFAVQGKSVATTVLLTFVEGLIEARTCEKLIEAPWWAKSEGQLAHKKVDSNLDNDAKNTWRR